MEILLGQIIQMRQLRADGRTYKDIANVLGVSQSTVSKYLKEGPKHVPVEDRTIGANLEFPLVDTILTAFRTKDWAGLCNITAQEESDVQELWKELWI